MLKNIFKVFLSNAVLTAVGLISSFIFPVLLSIEDYAYYQEYVLYLSYINICHLGIASGMFLNYAGKRYEMIDRKQYKSEIYLIYLVLSFFTFCGIVIYGVSKKRLILYVMLTIIPQCLIASFQALYQSWERFTAYSIINALPKILFTMVVVILAIIFNSLNGNIIICIYIIIIWGISLYLVIEFFYFTKGEKSNKIISKTNLSTAWNGFLITLGNYVNLIFHSIDKQFVHVLFSVTSFAQYSFAMSTQSIMTIFITALANPFYPKLAKGNIDKTFISKMKELLFVLGAYSGCAYFGVSFCVKHFISKYEDSLKVVAIFFAVFPAMAIINILYINLYKIRKIFKKYILTLIAMLILACGLNGISILFNTDYTGIAFATMVAYYIWLFYSQRDFEEIKINKKDILYLAGYFCIYFGLINITNDIVGFLVYIVVISVWNYLLYHNTIYYLVRTVINI